MADTLFPSPDEVPEAELFDPNIGEDFIEAEEDETLPYGFTWKFDFDKGDLFIDNFGGTVVVSDHDCLREWLAHTLNTERYETPIYGGDIGTELNRIIGDYATMDAYTMALVEKEIREAMSVHDRIDRVEKIAVIPVEYDMFTYMRYTTDDLATLEEVASF